MLPPTLLFLLAAAAGTPSVLVLPVGGDASADGKATNDLRAAVEGVGGFNVLGKKTTDDAVSTSRALGLTCKPDSAACALQLGGLAGADIVILAAVASSPGSSGMTALSARALDVGAGRERAHALVPYRAGETKDAKLLAVRLLAPDKERGRLLVRAAPNDAILLVDFAARTLGKPLDVTPDVEHDVYVAKPGFASFEQKVKLRFDEDLTIDVALKPDASMKSVAIPFALKDPPAVVVDEQGATKKKRVYRVAMYEIKDVDAPSRVPRVVTEALLVEMRKLDGVSVIGLDEIRTMIDFEAKKQAAGCTDDCLAEIADALGADAIFLPSIAHASTGTTVFGARRIDPKNGVVAQVRKDFVDANGEEYIASVGDVVKELFPDFPLKAGEHRGADPALALRVNPPPLSPWVFWSTIAASGAVAAGTAVTGVVNIAATNRFAGDNDAAQGSDVVANDALTAGTGVAFWTGVGVTAVALAGAGVEALFTDWWGYGNASDDDVDAIRKHVGDAAAGAAGGR